MSTILEKNLKVLEKRHKTVADQVRAIASSETRRYSVVKSPKGIPNLFDKMTNTFVYNQSDPFAGALHDVRNSKTFLNRLNYIIGYGLGYHTRAFLETHQTDNNVFFIIYEADVEVLFHALSTDDHTGMLSHPRMDIIAGKIDEGAAMHHIRSLFDETYPDLKYYIKASRFVETPYLFIAYKERYSTFFTAIKSAYSMMLNHFGNDPGDSFVGIVNTMKNIDIILKNPGIDTLEGKFKGRVGVVVSTGPSLQKNLHLLKEIQDKVVIVSVDASVRILQEHGIKPHAVTSLERVLETAKLFDGVEDDFVADTLFTACPVIRPETYANFAAKPVIVYRDFATFKWLGLERGPRLAIGPSSSNMGFCVLEYLGCDTIILIGQDFAYSTDGLTHAEGTVYGTQQDKMFARAYQDLEVEGNYVPKIRTTQVWDLFRKYMEQDANRFEGTTINATEGGAKINGTNLMTLRDAIDKYITPRNYDNDIPATLKKSVTPIDAKHLAGDFKAVQSRINEGVQYCQETMADYRKVIEMNSKIEAGKVNMQGTDIIDPLKLSDIFNEVQVIMIGKSSEDKFYLILMHYVQPYFIHILMDLYNVLNTVENQQERSLRFIKLSAVASITMIQLIERLEELFQSVAADLPNIVDTKQPMLDDAVTP